MLALLKFTTDTNAMRSWGGILRAVFIFAVLVVLGITVWDEVFPYGKPVEGLEGLPESHTAVVLAWTNPAS